LGWARAATRKIWGGPANRGRRWAGGCGGCVCWVWCSGKNLVETRSGVLTSTQRGSGTPGGAEGHRLGVYWLGGACQPGGSGSHPREYRWGGVEKIETKKERPERGKKSGKNVQSERVQSRKARGRKGRSGPIGENY